MLSETAHCQNHLRCRRLQPSLASLVWCQRILGWGGMSWGLSGAVRGCEEGCHQALG